MKIAFLSNYTNDLIVRSVKKRLETERIDGDVYISGYNQYIQEILGESTPFYNFNPELVFLSIDLNELLHDVFRKDFRHVDFEKVVPDRLAALFDRIAVLHRKLPDATLFLDNFSVDSGTAFGTMEYNSPHSVIPVMNKVNAELHSFALSRSYVRIIDVESLIRRYGEERLFDRRMHYVSKCKWSFFGIEKLSGLYLAHIKAYKGIRKKCIVVDLDNTLWGGIAGQDGIENIVLSSDGPGKAYYDFQKSIERLYHSGILLAVCSKNNDRDALEVMRNHPHMVLRPDRFTVMKINWERKDRNIREIAQELNIGLDSIVFLDDSDFERNLVLSQLPGVEAPALPEDPAYFADFLNTLENFNFHELTTDDFDRNKNYRVQAEREKSKSSFDTVEEYYRSLQMQVQIKPADDFSLPRIVQLINKTNQFNLTTRRYSEADIRRFMSNGHYHVLYLSLADRFGDNGIVGTAILTVRDSKLYIDSFILSCRVIGRTVETALLSYIYNFARDKSIEQIIGECIPTPKNEPCRNMYPVHGFDKAGENCWQLSTDKIIACPEWIEMKAE